MYVDEKVIYELSLKEKFLKVRLINEKTESIFKGIESGKERKFLKRKEKWKLQAKIKRRSAVKEERKVYEIFKYDGLEYYKIRKHIWHGNDPDSSCQEKFYKRLEKHT